MNNREERGCQKQVPPRRYFIPTETECVPSPCVNIECDDIWYTMYKLMLKGNLLRERVYIENLMALFAFQNF